MKVFILMLALCAGGFAGSVKAQEASAPASTIEAIVPDGSDWAIKDFQFSPAVRAGDYIYVSGVVATLEMKDGASAEATEEAMKAAYRGAFNAIAETLREAGADWRNVAEITSFHTELRAQGAAFMAVKREYTAEPYPAWTAIDVDRLWPDNGITEIKVVAYAPQ